LHVQDRVARVLARQLQLSDERAGYPGGSSQYGSIVMSIVSQIRNAGWQRDSIGRTPTIENLTADLRKLELALLESIAVEEQRTSLQDPNDPSYSTLAKSLRNRLDNLRRTISTLETAHKAA
jgi:hypothetical protein